MRIRGRQQEGGPVDVLGCEMAPREEDEDQLAALECGEHIFSDEPRIAIADSFRRQHFAEVIVIDWAIRIEDIFAGHLSAVLALSARQDGELFAADGVTGCLDKRRYEIKSRTRRTGVSSSLCFEVAVSDGAIQLLRVVEQRSERLLSPQHYSLPAKARDDLG